MAKRNMVQEIRRTTRRKFSPEQKLQILRLVESSPFGVRETLGRLDVSVSTCYRRRHRFRHHGLTGLRDRSSFKARVWNELLPEERDKILEVADQEPEWSPREVARRLAPREREAMADSGRGQHRAESQEERLRQGR